MSNNPHQRQNFDQSQTSYGRYNNSGSNASGHSIITHTNHTTMDMSQAQSKTVNSPDTGSVVSNVNVTVLNPGVSSENTQTTGTTPAQPQDFRNLARTAGADYEIYRSQLLTKKLGSPLWIPGPGRHLSDEYRQQGISIGDVGIITYNGAFDFLFNVFQPAGHPINRGKVPRGFTPLPFDELKDEILENDVYGPGSFLASPCVKRTHGNWIAKVFTYPRQAHLAQRFESTKKEAAILIMPDGSKSKDLRNTREIRDTIRRNAMDWYAYARHDRGRVDVENDDIRVVVGIDKVSSWGIATSACDTASFLFKLDSWDCTGGSGRVGPTQTEIEQDNPFQNQCLFIRTINFTLSGVMWNDFQSDAIKQTDQGSSKFGDPEGSGSSNRGGSSGNSGSPGLGGGGSTSPNNQTGSMPGSFCNQAVIFGPMEREANHPSTALHDYLHEKFPDADMVITEDMDWISVLNDEDTTFPGPEELCARIAETHELQNHGGIVEILRRDDSGLQTSRGMNPGKPQEETNNPQVGSGTPKDVNRASIWAADARKFAIKLGKKLATNP